MCLNRRLGGNHEIHDHAPWSGIASCAQPERRRRDHHHCHREQRPDDPDAAADGRLLGQISRHRTRMGHAGGERPAPARHPGHRHQGWPVRRHDHRHLRGSDLGQAGLAGAARLRRRLRHGRSAARHSRRPVHGRQAVRRALLRRILHGHVPQGPDGEGRPRNARCAELGFHQAGRGRDDRQGTSLPTRPAR